MQRGSNTSNRTAFRGLTDEEAIQQRELNGSSRLNLPGLRETLDYCSPIAALTCSMSQEIIWWLNELKSLFL
jgi:hypothetical protein